MTVEPTIDLGVLGHTDQQPEPPWPLGARLRRWAAHRRSWLTAAAAGVLVATMAGADVAPPAWPRPHLAIAVGGGHDHWPVLGGGTLYVMGAGEAGRAIAAYRPADGALLWQVDGSSFAYVWGDLPMLVSFHDPGTDQQRTQTTALDPETGAERWTAAGDAVAITDQVLLLHQARWEGWEQPDQPPVPYRLAAVDRETGTVRWSLPEAQTWTVGYDQQDRPAWLATVDSGNRVVTYDLTTGTQLATATVETPRPATVFGARDLVIMQPASGEPILAAFEANSLAHRWTVTLPAFFTYVSACGRHLCATDGTAPIALDPASGEVLWSIDDMPSGHLSHHFGDPHWPDSHLLLDDWLVDAATGELLLRLRGWHFATSGGGEPLLVRSEPGQGRAWLGRLRLDPPGVVVLGSVASQQGCTADEQYLACLDHGEIQLYRLR